MLMVNTYIGPSRIHGTGLFAARDISEGEEIWSYHPVTCQKYTVSKFLHQCYKLSFEEILSLLNYSYIRDNFVYSINDNTKYINHSLRANVALVSPFSEVAIKNIKKGEEILENYFDSYDENDFYFVSHLFEFKNKQHILSTLENFYATDKNIPCAVSN